MRPTAPLIAASFLSLAACSGGGGSDPAPPACDSPSSGLVFVLDDTGKLLSFDPALIGVSDPFALVGTPECAPGSALPPFSDPAVPLSIAVDRTGDARVLYTSGEIFRVSTVDASCTATGFDPAQLAGGVTWSLFGMAYASDAAGGDAERPWLSGGSGDGSLGSLGSVDPASLAVSTVGAIGGSAPYRPELMGLSDATLWGFFPNAAASFVQEIDKGSGALLGSPIAASLGSDALVAWGAAHSGGRFWVFATTTDGLTSNSTVRSYLRTTGSGGLVAQHLTRVVVAASSSTCAPLSP